MAIAGLPGGRLLAGPGLVPYILAGPWYLTGLTVAGLTGLLAVLAVILLAGGYATIRRVTV